MRISFFPAVTSPVTAVEVAEQRIHQPRFPMRTIDTAPRCSVVTFINALPFLLPPFLDLAREPRSGPD